jgi:hypothetical protein
VPAAAVIARAAGALLVAESLTGARLAARRHDRSSCNACAERAHGAIALVNTK